MKATTSLTVRRSPEEVFAFVSNPANMACWLSGVSASEAASEGSVGLGAALSSHYTYGGRTHLITYVVTAYEEGRCYGLRATSGPYPFENLVELEPAGAARGSSTPSTRGRTVGRRPSFLPCSGRSCGR